VAEFAGNLANFLVHPLIYQRLFLQDRKKRVRIGGISENPSARKASGNDASLLKTEIAAPARSGRAHDDVIHQMELQDSAGFEKSPSEAHIGFRRRRITRWMIVHQDEGIGRMRDHRLKDFSWVCEGLIDRPLTNRADLNEMLLGVEKKDRC
jgi:hypothetical protein